MALPEAAVGLLPCAGGTQWLSWTVGESWAKRMILLGERVDAARALQIGLADEVVARGQALGRALELAEAVCRQSPSAVTACKRLIQGARSGHPAAGAGRRARGLRRAVRHTGPARGRQRLPEKRAPQWRNA